MTGAAVATMSPGASFTFTRLTRLQFKSNEPRPQTIAFGIRRQAMSEALNLSSVRQTQA